jgi:hypothetical protein
MMQRAGWATGSRLAISAAIGLAASAASVLGGPCSKTASTLFDACSAEVSSTSLVKKANCFNISDANARSACVDEGKAERKEGNQLCQEQRDGRLEACHLLGEARYDPDFRPALFDDPRSPTKPDPYFPLTIGNLWEYKSQTQRDTVEVVNETKNIAGVTCVVFRDLVTENGELVEATDDWYAPAKDGSTWYFGEEAKDFESFDGDDPKRPELVSIEGSFKAGREHSKPGIIFLASPKPGDVYLEEFSLANAEDVTEILSTTYSFGHDPELDQSVPQKLAETLCSGGDCVVTKNFSLLEPGIFARKYYARGIGVILEVEPDSGEVLQLVHCNFDQRCQNL